MTMLSAAARRFASRNVFATPFSVQCSSSIVSLSSKQQQQQQSWLSLSRRSMSDLPYHLVVGMPALSPTMESGTLASWTVAEGDSFEAGSVLARIETDKASIDFEAQDDGHVAKLLVDDGAQDIPVGQPIMVTVEEAEHVEAFADFEPPAEAEPAAAAEPAAEPEPAAATPEPTPEVKEEVVAAKEEVPAPEPKVAAPPPPPVETVQVAVPTMGPAWGSSAKVASPIAMTLSKSQQAYIDQYGTTGQLPL